MGMGGSKPGVTYTLPTPLQGGTSGQGSPAQRTTSTARGWSIGMGAVKLGKYGGV